MLNNYRGPGPVPESELATVKEVLNLPGNLRMVNSKTNLSEHNIIDNALIANATSGEVLTTKEENRATLQVNFILSTAAEYFTESTLAAFRKFYKALKTSSGRTLWDERREPRSN